MSQQDPKKDAIDKSQPDVDAGTSIPAASVADAEHAYTPETAGNAGLKKGTRAAAGKMNLLDYIAVPQGTTTPEIIRIEESEKALTPFTADFTMIHVHWCDESEVRGYVHCLGVDCLLCRAGKRIEDRILLPVMVPTEHRIGLLMMSTSRRPGALLYQLGQPLLDVAGGKRVVLFIRRIGNQFTVGARELHDGENDGAAQVKQFQADFNAGKIDLRQAVQSLTREQVLAIPGIAEMLRLKGIVA